MARSVEISFDIDGRRVSREEVLPREMERAGVAAKRLGIVGLPDDVAEACRALVERKLELGHGRIRELCMPDVRKAERMVGTMRKLSLGRVKKCRMEVFAKGISADEFVGWFVGRSAANDEAAMIAAHPEHYIIVNEGGRQVGGAMHQFRDDDGGLRGVLSIDYPLLTPGAVMSGHKVHLAIEFSNWIEAAAASIG